MPFFYLSFAVESGIVSRVGSATDLALHNCVLEVWVQLV